MWEYGFSQTHILPYEDKIEDVVFIRENTGQWETRISRMFYALSTSIFNVWRSLNFSFNFNFPRFFALSFTLIHFVRRFISIYHFAFLLLIYIYIFGKAIVPSFITGVNVPILIYTFLLFRLLFTGFSASKIVL